MGPVNEAVDNPVEQLLKRQELARDDVDGARFIVRVAPGRHLTVGLQTRRCFEALARCLQPHRVGDGPGQKAMMVGADGINDARALLAEILL